MRFELRHQQALLRLDRHLDERGEAVQQPLQLVDVVGARRDEPVRPLADRASVDVQPRVDDLLEPRQDLDGKESQGLGEPLLARRSHLDRASDGPTQHRVRPDRICGGFADACSRAFLAWIAMRRRAPLERETAPRLLAAWLASWAAEQHALQAAARDHMLSPRAVRRHLAVMHAERDRVRTLLA